MYAGTIIKPKENEKSKSLPYHPISDKLKTMLKKMKIRRDRWRNLQKYAKKLASEFPHVSEEDAFHDILVQVLRIKHRTSSSDIYKMVKKQYDTQTNEDILLSSINISKCQETQDPGALLNLYDLIQTKQQCFEIMRNALDYLVVETQDSLRFESSAYQRGLVYSIEHLLSEVSYAELGRREGISRERTRALSERFIYEIGPLIVKEIKNNVPFTEKMSDIEIFLQFLNILDYFLFPEKVEFRYLWKHITSWKYDELAELYLSYAKRTNRVDYYARGLEYLLIATSLDLVDKNKVEETIKEIDKSVLDRLQNYLNKRIKRLEDNAYLKEEVEYTIKLLELLEG